MISAEILLNLFNVQAPLKFSNVEDYRYIESDNPLLGYEMLPNERKKLSDQNRILDIWTNSFGLRDKERNINPNNNNTTRIAFLGDSVLMGSELLISELPTVQLEGNFLKNHRNVEVLNFSTDGYCTEAEVALFEKKGLQFRPQVVVLNYVRNDTNNFNADLNERIVHNKFIGSYVHLIKKSIILSWSYYFLQMYRQQKAMKMQQNVFNNNIEKGLLKLTELSKKFNFKIYVFIWPEFMKNGQILSCEDSGYEVSCPLTHLKVEDLAEKLNIQSFRLDKYFQDDFNYLKKTKKTNLNPKDYYTEDGMHPVARGGAAAGEIFYKILDSELKLNSF